MHTFCITYLFQRVQHDFKPGMKVELIDKRNPILCRVATVSDINKHELLVHFDGWSEAYDYWIDDDCPDIHPVGWCQKSGHPLMAPIGNKITTRCNV